jgi:polysaccharide pyruvyl transferase WcaK-like protein
MHIIAIGDIGVTDQMMHIGDEAMFEALVDETRARGATAITGLSAAPRESAVRYGIDALPRIGFAPARAAGAERFAAVVRAIDAGGGLSADDPFWAVRNAVASATGVVIAGGGNMASTWPLHIFERAALARIAAAAGVPLVVTGQTLGPELTPPDRVVLGEALRSARVVGLREEASGRLAAELGVPGDRARVTLDDASFLGWDDPSGDSAGGAGAAGYTLVSLSTHLGGRDRRAIVRGLAHLLDRHADETGQSTRFHAHWGSLRSGESRGDAILHDEVRAQMRTPSDVVPTGDPRAAARLARGASLLVSSRYHPVVFAAPAGVPVLALSADDYTRVKLNGALGRWGQHGVRDLDEIAGAGTGAAGAGMDAAADALRGIHSSSAQTRATADGLRPSARAAAAAWWDRVAEALAP